MQCTRGIIGRTLLLPLGEVHGETWPCTLPALPVPMESLQNHIAGIKEKCNLMFLCFLCLAQPLPGGSKRSQCDMALAGFFGS